MDIMDLLFYTIVTILGIFLVFIVYFWITTKRAKLNFDNWETGEWVSKKGWYIKDWQIQWYWKVKKSDGSLIEWFFKDGVLEWKWKITTSDSAVTWEFVAWQMHGICSLSRENDILTWPYSNWLPIDWERTIVSKNTKPRRLKRQNWLFT